MNDQLPDVVPQKMGEFLEEIDDMDEVSVEVVDDRPMSFDVRLEYTGDIRLVKLKALGQDLGARGFEAKGEFNPKADKEAIFEWRYSRYVDRVIGHE